MYYEEESAAASFAAGMIIGVAVGAGLALVLAPQSGRRTRRYLVRRVEDVTDDAADRWGDVTDELKSAVRSSRKKFPL